MDEAASMACAISPLAFSSANSTCHLIEQRSMYNDYNISHYNSITHRAFFGRSTILMVLVYGSAATCRQEYRFRIVKDEGSP